MTLSKPIARSSVLRRYATSILALLLVSGLFISANSAPDIMPSVDTVGELVQTELGSLLGCKSSKVRDSCLLRFFSGYEVIQAKKINSSSKKGML